MHMLVDQAREHVFSPGVGDEFGLHIRVGLPGLIDEHVHLNVSNSNIGANADLLCIPMGVTTAVDAGTSG